MFKKEKWECYSKNIKVMKKKNVCNINTKLLLTLLVIPILINNRYC